MSDFFLVESILDKSSAFMCVLDPEGKIVNINSRFAQLFGKAGRESLVGTTASEQVQGCVELKSFFQTLSMANDTAIPEGLIQPVHRNAEKPLWIKFDISQVHSSSHGVCTFISGTDITEEIVSRREAEQKAHERSSFIVRMGHELRTPLNTIHGYSQLLLALDGMPEIARDYIRTVISNENNLLRLISDLLELSKFEAGQTTPLKMEANVKKLLNEVTTGYADQFAAKSLTLKVDFKTEVPEAIMTDPQKVSQVLSNILGNALKFTRKGGVTISVSCDRNVVFDIEDTGIGINADERSQIFELFNQTGASKEHMAGSGIGLPIARIFARMLGGDVVLIRSETGTGSLFRFTLPADRVNATKTNVKTITDYTSIKGISHACKVLLVDDVDINLAMLEIFLAPAGFEVCIAANGNEAVEKFRSFRPDIVFMDLIMPEKDGFEATREIKAIDQSIPVVALTASIVDTVKEQALESGVNDFMFKPFVPERFFEIIAEHTGIEYVMKD